MPASRCRSLPRLTALLAALTAVLALTVASAPAAADHDTAPPPGSAHDEVSDLIVDQAELGAAVAGIHELGYDTGQVRQLEDGAVSVALADPVDAAEAASISDTLQRTDVAGDVEPDDVLHPAYVPDDARYTDQWSLHDLPYSVHAESAWQLTRGSRDVTVAVLDTGELRHPDTVQRLVPGYNLITLPDRAGNTYGRGPDATDTGDACPGRRTRPTWHGVRVAGVIGAVADNGDDIAGIDHHARIQHVRVLGRCGGAITDIADGIRWAAGLPVGDLPLNETPADVINLSLGGRGLCIKYLQDAIDAATDHGAIVVAAAGNESFDLGSNNYRPANCDRVITVTATTAAGEIASYSNFGERADVAAPAGTNLNSRTGRALTVSHGSTVNGPVDASGWITDGIAGTSAAAPHVAATIAMMRARDPELDTSTARDVLQATASPFNPSGGRRCESTPGDGGRACGAGIVHTAAAVATVDGPLPPRPATLHAEVSDARAEVSWQQPTDHGAGPFTHELYTTTGPACSLANAELAYAGTAEQVTVELSADTTTRVCHYAIGSDGQVSLRSGPLELRPGQRPRTDPSPEPEPDPGTPVTFRDVRGGPHAHAISWMAEHGITTGCSDAGEFCPNDPVTREQMASLLTRAFDLPAASHAGFVDVPAGTVHARSVNALVGADITRGCSTSGAFCPRDTVTRAQMASFLARARQLRDGDVSVFTDVPAGSQHAGPIGAMHRERITLGCGDGPDRFCPTVTVTRAQMASFLHRTLHEPA